MRVTSCKPSTQDCKTFVRVSAAGSSSASALAPEPLSPSKSAKESSKALEEVFKRELVARLSVSVSFVFFEKLFGAVDASLVSFDAGSGEW